MKCGRCARETSDPDREFCWFCGGNLCGDCWEEIGHCGRPEADAINQAARMADHATQGALIRPFVHGTLIAATWEPEESDNG